MQKLKIGAVMLCLLISSPFIFAQAMPHHIDVQGQAEIRIVPDEAILTLGVESWAVDLNAARKDNDLRIGKILAVPASLGIDKKFVQTGYISIEPIYAEENRTKLTTIASYKVRKDITILVKDLSILDTLVSNILNAGANRFNQIEFRTSKLRELRDQARIAAIKAAKEKAVALAGELGQKVGAPISISESGGSYSGGLRGMVNQNVMYDMIANESSAAPTMSIGQISVNASVSVSFELAKP